MEEQITMTFAKGEWLILQMGANMISQAKKAIDDGRISDDDLTTMMIKILTNLFNAEEIRKKIDNELHLHELKSNLKI